MGKYLYRIQSFDRVVEIFKKGEIYLAHPGRWDDPYESRLKHAASEGLFAQCWSTSAQSDAMWRIYSPDRLGLRIRTTREALRTSIKDELKVERMKHRLSDVEYLPQKALNQRLRVLADTLKENFTPSGAADALQWKRMAFEHEKEVRLIVYRDKDRPKPEEGLKLKVDPFKLIDDILIDPRAPQAYVDAFALYLKKEVGFQGEVKRSLLYAEQQAIEVIQLDAAA